MIPKTLRLVWDEPAAEAPPAASRWDILVVVVLAPATVAEVLQRDDVPWPWYAAALSLVCVLTVLWRTRHPLGMLALAFGAQTLAGVGPALAGLEYGVPNTTAVVLLLAYSLGRWASGRHAVLGVLLLMVVHFLREPLYGFTAQDNLIGAGFLLFPVALGASVRFWTTSRRRAVEEVRLLERARLARELHDTVAHHVSGIVIQAQAGQAVAAVDAQRALAVLPVIEAAASRSLSEMRSLVGILRDGEPAEHTPAPGVADIATLARDATDGPPVRVDLAGDLDGLPSPVDAAVFRVVQESITNARWHGHEATHIDVRVAGARDEVSIEVVDDGRSDSRPGRGAAAGRGPGSGFGIVGMTERVESLGGRLSAGPRSEHGWVVRAEIPRGARP